MTPEQRYRDNATGEEIKLIDGWVDNDITYFRTDSGDILPGLFLVRNFTPIERDDSEWEQESENE